MDRQSTEYKDGSLTEGNGRRTGYGTVGYAGGQRVFDRSKTLGQIFDAPMNNAYTTEKILKA